jgi:N-acetylglucosamine-6-phosphate deacetylase
MKMHLANSKRKLESAKPQDIKIIKTNKLIFPERIDRGILVIHGGKIVEIKKRISRLRKCENYDFSQLFVAPGFVDLQVNGGLGIDFLNASPEEIKKIIDFYLSHGTTGIVVTLVSSSLWRIRQALERIRSCNTPSILGVHLEGPFISKEYKGAHDGKYILPPSKEMLVKIIDQYSRMVRIVTLAPELSGADEVIDYIVNLGAVAALGHSSATYAEAIQAIEKGVKLFTHLGNAMRGLHHREPGAIGAALDSDAYVSLICDGIHLHPAFVRLVTKLKGFDRVCLITDAVSATGLADGTYYLGDLPVVVTNGIARLPNGVLAGSTITMERAVQNFVKFTKCSLPEAIRCATLNPARLLGIDSEVGSINIGKWADLIVFDNDFDIKYVFFHGNLMSAS